MPELETFSPNTTGWVATTVNSIMIQKIRELPVGYTYTLVEGESVTPDLIAALILNNQNYAWIIMAYNNFLDIREMSYDYGARKIYVPDKVSLTNLVATVINSGG